MKSGCVISYKELIRNLPVGERIGTLVVELDEAPSFSVVGELGPVGLNAELVVLPGPDSEQLLSGSESRSCPPMIPEGMVVPPDK